MACKRNAIFCASFHFPAIRFDAPTLLSFIGCAHAHVKCPPVGLLACYQVRFGGREDRAGRAVPQVSLSAIKYFNSREKMSKTLQWMDGMDATDGWQLRLCKGIKSKTKSKSGHTWVPCCIYYWFGN